MFQLCTLFVQALKCTYLGTILFDAKRVVIRLLLLLTFFSIVHGQWSEWSDWEGCSSTCGQGTQLRHRLCASPEPANGGRDCAGLPVESQPCTVRQCPGNVNVLVNVCTKKCVCVGGGVGDGERECSG